MADIVQIIAKQLYRIDSGFPSDGAFSIIGTFLVKIVHQAGEEENIVLTLVIVPKKDTAVVNDLLHLHVPNSEYVPHKEHINF